MRRPIPRSTSTTPTCVKRAEDNRDWHCWGDEVGLPPPPLWGRVGEGGGCWTPCPTATTPLPVPPPQGGRERCGAVRAKLLGSDTRHVAQPRHHLAAEQRDRAQH